MAGGEKNNVCPIEHMQIEYMQGDPHHGLFWNLTFQLLLTIWNNNKFLFEQWRCKNISKEFYLFLKELHLKIKPRYEVWPWGLRHDVAGSMPFLE